MQEKLSTFRSRLTRTSGQSLIEVVIALAVGVVLILATFSIVAPVLRSSSDAFRAQAGAALGKELFDNVRVWAEGQWPTFYGLGKGAASHYHLAATSSPFTVVFGEEQLTVASTTFTRYFYVENTSRDAGGFIVSSGGTNDPSTQKVTVVYEWRNTTRSLAGYLTRSENSVVVQTDWGGGGGEEGPLTQPTNTFSTSSKIDFVSTPGAITIDFFGT